MILGSQVVMVDVVTRDITNSCGNRCTSLSGMYPNMFIKQSLLRR